MTAVLGAQGVVPRRSARVPGVRTGARRPAVGAGALAFLAPARSPAGRRPAADRHPKAVPTASADRPGKARGAGPGSPPQHPAHGAVPGPRAVRDPRAVRARTQAPLRLTARGRAVVAFLGMALAVAGATGRMFDAGAPGGAMAGTRGGMGTATAGGPGAPVTGGLDAGPVAVGPVAVGTVAVATVAVGTVAGGAAPGLPLGVVSSAVGPGGSPALR